jgi:ABC-type transport system involved in cytochrome c biogenesis permease subunit
MSDARTRSASRSFLPSLEEIDRNVYRTIAFGFPLLTLVIITGAVWAQYVWQRWWSWDPKETASLVTWLVYAGYLHGRRQRNWSGRSSAIFAVVGFLAVLFTFAGVNFLNSIHSYGMPQAATGGRILGGFEGVPGPEAVVTTGFFLAYLVSFLMGLAAALWKSNGMAGASTGLAMLGLVGNTVVLIMRIVAAGRISFTAGYDFSLWFVWGITLCAIIASVRGQRLALVVSLPLALMVAMYGYLYFADKGHEALAPALQNKFWLHLHVSLAILAYGALALAAGWGVLYLIKQAATRRDSGGSEDPAGEGSRI